MTSRRGWNLMVGCMCEQRNRDSNPRPSATVLTLTTVRPVSPIGMLCVHCGEGTYQCRNGEIVKCTACATAVPDVVYFPLTRRPGGWGR